MPRMPSKAAEMARRRRLQQQRAKASKRGMAASARKRRPQRSGVRGWLKRKVAQRKPVRMEAKPASQRGAGLHIPVVGTLWKVLGFKWLFETLMNTAFRGQRYRQVKRRGRKERTRPASLQEPPTTPAERLQQARGSRSWRASHRRSAARKRK